MTSQNSPNRPEHKEDEAWDTAPLTRKHKFKFTSRILRMRSTSATVNENALASSRLFLDALILREPEYYIWGEDCQPIFPCWPLRGAWPKCSRENAELLWIRLVDTGAGCSKNKRTCCTNAGSSWAWLEGAKAGPQFPIIDNATLNALRTKWKWLTCSVVPSSSTPSHNGIQTTVWNNQNHTITEG